MTNPGQSESGWFEVRATVKVRAKDANSAVTRIAGALRGELWLSDPLWPVGEFSARPIEDPQQPRKETVHGS